LQAISGETARLTAGFDSGNASTGHCDSATGAAVPLVSREVAVQTGNYLHYYQAVAACLSDYVAFAATDPANPVTAEEALTTIKIIELARQSSSLGQVMAFA
jgi:predicted dehydrogenase